MSGYSLEQFQKDWVYACREDFKGSDGQPYTWAPGQPSQWGDESFKIPLPTKPADASLNADGTLLAVALQHDIHIYTVNDFTLLQVLKGHVSRVDAVRFHPKEPRTLLSCSENHWGGSVVAEAAIILWKLHEHRERILEVGAMLQALGKRAVEGVVAGLHDMESSWTLAGQEKESLAEDFEKTITLLNLKSQVQDHMRIHGRLSTSYGSQVFNDKGTSLIFLPGERPRSNTVDKWDICVWNIERREISLTLEAHTDAIMWVGFSPDDKLIASVSWDKTFRIWSHTDGSLLHTFKSDSQNFTGGFSPDSRFFAGTSGRGRFWVWDISDGSEIMTYAFEPQSPWSRTLDWSPSGKQLIIGGGGLGRLSLFDLESRSEVQRRVLSPEKSAEEVRNFGESFMEVTIVRFFAGGRYILSQTSSDRAIEVYDTVHNTKWRFAPPQGQTMGWGSDFVVLAKQGLIASIDADAVRFWKGPFDQRE